MKTIVILINRSKMNKVNKFINACNIKEDFSPSMFDKLDILVSDTKDSEKLKLFDLTGGTRFFQLDPNNDIEFNKCDKNVAITAKDYSVVPSVNDIETLKQKIDKDNTKCFWLAVEFEEVVELKKSEKSSVKSKAFKGLSKIADEKADKLEKDAMNKAKKIFDAKLIIETKQYISQIKKLELDLKKAQKTSADLRLLLKKKDNKIKSLTIQLKDAKKKTYTATQYNDMYNKYHTLNNSLINSKNKPYSQVKYVEIARWGFHVCDNDRKWNTIDTLTATYRNMSFCDMGSDFNSNKNMRIFYYSDKKLTGFNIDVYTDASNSHVKRTI